MVILRGVLKVKFTKYCTCAAGNPGQAGELSRPWTGFFIIVELEPYMLKAYLRNFGKDGHGKNPEDSSNEILKILDMGSISSRKHEMEIW